MSKDKLTNSLTRTGISHAWWVFSRPLEASSQQSQTCSYWCNLMNYLTLSRTLSQLPSSMKWITSSQLQFQVLTAQPKKTFARSLLPYPVNLMVKWTLTCTESWKINCIPWVNSACLPSFCSRESLPSSSCYTSTFVLSSSLSCSSTRIRLSWVSNSRRLSDDHILHWL